MLTYTRTSLKSVSGISSKKKAKVLLNKKDCEMMTNIRLFQDKENKTIQTVIQEITAN